MQDHNLSICEQRVVPRRWFHRGTGPQLLALIAAMLFVSGPRDVEATSFLEATQAQIIFTGTALQISATGETRITGELGRGTFSYSASNADRVYEVIDGLPVFPVSPQIAVTSGMNLRLVDAVQISIQGIDFNKSYAGAGSGTSEYARDYFWRLPLDAGDSFPDPASNMGPAMVVEYGPPGNVRLQNDWRFGYTRATYLGMDPNGGWLMVHPFPDSQNPELYSVYASGTWRAEPVPEPLTVLGTLVAIGFGWGFHRLARGRHSAI